MIVVEGMDNTGKTTLINYLKLRIKELKILDSGGPVLEGQELERLTQLMIWLPYSKYVLIDRISLISEEVYGPILRSGNALAKIYDYDCLMDWFKSFNPFIIYCRPPENNIFSTFTSRDQMKGVFERREQLLSRYDLVMAELMRSGFNIYKYDYTEREAKEQAYGKVGIHLRLWEIKDTRMMI